jgi:sulfonate transport system substrate-binding protein
MRTLISRVLLTAAAAALALPAAGCSSSQGTNTASGTIVIRIPDPGNSGSLALGKKDGSLAAALAKVGATVQWTGSAGAFAPAAQELDANELDVAEGSITSAIAALAQDPGFKLFAAVAPDEVGEGILVKNDSGITSVADLAGRKVVVWHGGTSEYLLLKALAKYGVPASSVQRVYLEPNESAAVLHSGQVDAWATWAQFSIAERADAGEHFLVTGGQVDSQNYAVWAVRSAFAQAHPAVVAALSAYLHSEDLKEEADPDAFINVFHTSGPDAVSGAELTLTAQDYQDGGPTSPITQTDIAGFQDVAQFFADEKVTQGVVDFKPYLLDVTTPAGS